MRTAFLGLGHMGRPMATNLARSGADLVVWNRTPGPAAQVAQAGADTAGTAAEAVAASEVVIVMLADDRVVDLVLDRGGPGFARLAGRTVVQMGTTSPAYSLGLGRALEEVGARYVEAPVSGSRVPAEQAQLVAMVAGPADLVPLVSDLVAPMCRTVVAVGEVPQALAMKLAVNTFLITQVVGLVESFHLARAAGLDLEVFGSVLDAGPMASAVSTMKLDKLVRGDFAVQASAADVLYNARLIDRLCAEVGVELPLMRDALGLLARAVRAGHGAEDMVAVIRALEGE
ncbi:MAG TPA: NAD(P)-dependent oxidoreductase [Nocardioides sp.]|nr:NAD(P)-dependent oxidoreductase [Nocardioides sp.]